jgi:hypothetical protein
MKPSPTSSDEGGVREVIEYVLFVAGIVLVIAVWFSGS